MKTAMWALGLLVLSLFGVVLVNLFGNITVTDQLNYTTMKNTVEASMMDSLDIAHYRAGFCLCTNVEKTNNKWEFKNYSDYELFDIEYDEEHNEKCENEKYKFCEVMMGEYRIKPDTFKESLVRRFAEMVNNSKDYQIVFQDIVEYPPKVSIRVISSDEEFSPTEQNSSGYDITNQIDAIIEVNKEIKATMTPVPATPEPTPTSDPTKYSFCCVKGNDYLWKANETTKSCPNGYTLDETKDSNSCKSSKYEIKVFHYIEGTDKKVAETVVTKIGKEEKYSYTPKCYRIANKKLYEENVKDNYQYKYDWNLEKIKVKGDNNTTYEHNKAITNISSDLKLVCEYKKIPVNIIVHHYVEGTKNTKVHEDDVITTKNVGDKLIIGRTSDVKDVDIKPYKNDKLIEKYKKDNYFSNSQFPKRGGTEVSQTTDDTFALTLQYADVSKGIELAYYYTTGYTDNYSKCKWHAHMYSIWCDYGKPYAKSVTCLRYSGSDYDTADAAKEAKKTEFITYAKNNCYTDCEYQKNSDISFRNYVGEQIYNVYYKNTYTIAGDCRDKHATSPQNAIANCRACDNRSCVARCHN